MWSLRELSLYSSVGPKKLCHKGRAKPGSLPHESCGAAAGFTLIEMLVALACGAILLSIAIPAFRTLLQNYQVSTQADDFLGSVQVARSEAVKRGASSKKGAWPMPW